MTTVVLVTRILIAVAFLFTLATYAWNIWDWPRSFGEPIPAHLHLIAVGAMAVQVLMFFAGLPR